MVKRLENKVKDVNFRELFQLRDFIPLVGAPIYLGKAVPTEATSMKNVLKQSTYAGLVCAYQVPFYVGLFYVIDRIFNLKFF